MLYPLPWRAIQRQSSEGAHTIQLNTMTIEVWYTLNGSPPSRVKVEDGANVVDLKIAIKMACPNTLNAERCRPYSAQGVRWCRC